MASVAFPARFQPLHRGHCWTVERYRPEWTVVLAVRGAGRSRTGEHPLSARERREVIRARYPEAELVEIEERRVGEAEADWARRLVERCRADAVVAEDGLADRVAAHTDAEVLAPAAGGPTGAEVRRRVREGEGWRELVPEACAERVADYAEVIAMSTPL